MDIKVKDEDDKYLYLVYRLNNYPKIFNYKLPKKLNKNNINLQSYILSNALEQRNIKKKIIDFNVLWYD
jgi:hypothetical protein